MSDDGIAQHNLGMDYAQRPGGDREAARLFKLAADKGLAQAQFNLGLFYIHGRAARRMLARPRATINSPQTKDMLPRSAILEFLTRTGVAGCRRRSRGRTPLQASR